MRFDKIIPTDKLKSCVKYFVISENFEEQTYKVFPGTGLVIGLQYKGSLSLLNDDLETKLSSTGVTGISSGFKVFKNSAGIGTILIYFTEVGFAHFTAVPANELFNQSISLDYVFDKNKVQEVEERLSTVNSDEQRIKIVENFLLSQLKEVENDKLIIEAVRLIYHARGAIKISALIDKLHISQSPFEKRFRRLVGTSAKKFASIVRFNSVLSNLAVDKSLTEICYENNFFDQAHFIKDFKQFTGDTPENFKRFL